jgi:hypothetical protein
MKAQEFRQAINAGILAGIIFLVFAMIVFHVFTDNTLWAFPRITAAIVMGKNVLPPAASFDLGIVLVGVIVHLALCVIYSVFLALFIHLTNLPASVITGLIYGLMLYFISINLTGGLFNGLVQSGSWIYLLSTILFGGTCGFLFKEFQLHQKCKAC